MQQQMLPQQMQKQQQMNMEIQNQLNENQYHSIKVIFRVGSMESKPIIVECTPNEKVNDVKSQFFVEDTNKVYKYTLKEVDIEGK